MKKVILLTSLLFLAKISFAQKTTFANDVASIIYTNCTSCHHAGSIAPFGLENYQDVYNNRYAILSAVQSKLMPPWSPDPSYTHFAEERKLNDDQVNTLIKWVSDGAIRGDAAVEPPKPVFSNASKLPSIDLSKRITAHKVATNSDEFKFFSIPSGLSKDAVIKQMELLPANNKIVHHIFLFIDSTGNFDQFIKKSNGELNGNNYLSGGELDKLKLIGGWLPGGSYYTVPENLGIRVPKSSFYIVQIHYAPGSINQSDSTQLNIKYTSDKGLRNMAMKALLDNRVNLLNGSAKDSSMLIPANSIKSYQEKYLVPADMSLISITPHMHLIGKRLKVYAYNDKGDTLKIIDDRWNFHWQGMYTFPKMVHIKQGYYLFAEGTYDNTTNNSDNPNNPPKDIVSGTSTLTEMMQVFFCYLPYKNGDENIVLDSAAVNGGTTHSGINTPTQDQISCSVWPNPVGNGKELNIELNGQGSASTIQLCGVDGRLIQTFGNRTANSKFSVQLPQLPTGLYFIKIATTQSVLTRKLVIE